MRLKLHRRGVKFQQYFYNLAIIIYLRLKWNLLSGAPLNYKKIPCIELTYTE